MRDGIQEQDRRPLELVRNGRATRQTYLGPSKLPPETDDQETSPPRRCAPSRLAQRPLQSGPLTPVHHELNDARSGQGWARNPTADLQFPIAGAALVCISYFQSRGPSIAINADARAICRLSSVCRRQASSGMPENRSEPLSRCESASVIVCAVHRLFSSFEPILDGFFR